MALVRWDPGQEVDSLQGEVNRLFNNFFGTEGNAGALRRWVPAMDLAETEDEFVIRADLPGMGEDDIDLEVKESVLTISGERATRHEDEQAGYHRVERAYGHFARTLTLPEGVDPEAVKASFDNGVLEIRVPKPEQRTPHRVAISGGSVEGKATEKS